MRSITQTKSLRDVRTTVSTHARSVPRQKGSTYLEIYLRDKEKQRLETELAIHAKSQQRIEARLREIGQETDKLLRGAQQKEQAPSSPHPSAGGQETSTPTNGAAAPGSSKWRRIAVGY
jgi:vacuolar-type H+-ATPase subunit I/STV1